MAPEKTHSQNPSCSPAGRRGQIRPHPQPAPPERVLALFCHSDCLRFSLTKFCNRNFSGFVLHLVCQSLSLFIYNSLFLRDDTESDFSLQLQPSSVMEGPGNPHHFFLCHSQAKEDWSYSLLFTLKLQKTISKLILLSFCSLPSV